VDEIERNTYKKIQAKTSFRLKETKLAKLGAKGPK
jgi:hypothetical protein